MNVFEDKILLPEGDIDVEVIQFEKTDRAVFKSIYDNWVSLSDSLEAVKGRRVNLPEGLSEGAVCLELNPHIPRGSASVVSN